MRIETARLWLVQASNDVLSEDLKGADALAKALGVDVAEWPPSSEYDDNAINYMIALQDRDPNAYDWGFRYMVLRAQQPTLIGCGGYTGPAKDGAIEIGYSVCPTFRRQGIATEATRGLVDHAFRNSDVARVIARTLPHFASSIGVLEKSGFHLAGAGAEEGTVRYEIERVDWVARSQA
jgi:RimJ/RimL family protein N-acetyltransferase